MKMWPPKDPDEILDYEFDWASKRLESGETIVTSDWIVAEGSVTIETNPPPSHQNGITKVWLGGGDLGDTCIIINRLTTSLDRTREWSAKLKIKASG